MIKNKFQFKTIANVIQTDWEALKLSMREIDDGEIIVRKRIEWNVDRMRRFFHGPVLDFLRAQFKETGTVKSKDEIKVWAKGQFLDREERNGIEFLRSTASLSRDEYIKFLIDIDDFCKEWFNCSLPEQESVE